MDRRRFLTRLMHVAAASLLPPVARPVFANLPERTGMDRHAGRMVLIIDDIGYSRRRAEAFAGLDVPLTFAVLPQLPKSRRLAESLHDRGFDILLHQPMEPLAPDLNPGPGALYTGDSQERIAGVLAENLAEMPFALGVNNHMGSKFTSAPGEMRATLTQLQARELLFVDSLTSPRSVGYGTARQMGMNSLRRNEFIDHIPHPRSVLRRLQRLEALARSHGTAIGIGHPLAETLTGLRRYLDTRPGDAPPITTTIFCRLL
jgi:polysaccharide deacetylase 2 family uncharacterized protein YibQ